MYRIVFIWFNLVLVSIFLLRIIFIHQQYKITLHLSINENLGKWQIVVDNYRNRV